MHFWPKTKDRFDFPVGMGRIGPFQFQDHWNIWKYLEWFYSFLQTRLLSSVKNKPKAGLGIRENLGIENHLVNE